jgi:REP element-mobilizing transposase RayT
MPNHDHLLLETPQANLSRAVGWLQTTYTIRFHHRYRRSGRLFQGRFKAQVVEADSYALELLRYVHLNPVRPKTNEHSFNSSGAQLWRNIAGAATARTLEKIGRRRGSARSG